MLEVYSKQLEELSAEAMELNRIEKEDVKEEERMWVDPELGLIATFKQKIKKGKK
jgi:hypothetical protein